MPIHYTAWTRGEIQINKIAKLNTECELTMIYDKYNQISFSRTLHCPAVSSVE